MATMAEKRDYYEVLEIERSASDAQISEAYRKLAMRFHPDRNPGDDEAIGRFKEAAEAFEVLSSPEKRAKYDRYGHRGIDGSAGGSPHFHERQRHLRRVRRHLRRSVRRRRPAAGRRVRQGADIRCDVKIDLFEAAQGTAKVVHFHRHEQCASCGGTGARKGTKPEVCPYCGGNGRVIQSTGIFSMQSTCPSCRGTGSVVRDPCPDCSGSGYVARRVTRKVNIPAGVDSQTQLRLQGEGEPSPDDGPPGDCYCFIRVSEHPLFQRQGRHVICRLPISYSQAALGATIEVPTLTGPEEVQVPPGSQNGDVLKLTGRGMPDPRYHGRGDLLLQLHIEVPEK